VNDLHQNARDFRSRHSKGETFSEDDFACLCESDQAHMENSEQKKEDKLHSRI